MLLVDDEESIRELARLVLERAGATSSTRPRTGSWPWSAIDAHTRRTCPLVVLLDNRMPGPSGLEVAAEMLSDFPTQIVVLFSAHLDQEITAQAEDLGVAACVPKQDVTRLPGILEGLLKGA